MVSPARVLRFGAAAFGTRAACSGNQIAAIVAAIDAAYPGLRWYVADIECSDGQFVPSRTPTPVLVGDADTLKHAALQVDQFISGVFVGIPPARSDPHFREGGLWTEDDEHADLGDALVEVRAFDTTYISVASTDETILQCLETAFETA